MQLKNLLERIYGNSLIEIVTLGYVRLFYGTRFEAMADKNLGFAMKSEVVNIVPFEAETNESEFTVALQIMVRF